MRPPLARLEARTQVSTRRGQPEGRDNEGVLRVRSRSGAPRILADKRDCAEDGVSAVVVGVHARGRRGVSRRRRVLTRALSGRGVVTPDLAQQGGVLPYCQRQHDPKDSCSKHVMLATPEGKTCATRKAAGCLENPHVFSGPRAPHRGICGISPGGAENSRGVARPDQHPLRAPRAAGADDLFRHVSPHQRR